jgi:rod shape-determining protein MreC
MAKRVALPFRQLVARFGFLLMLAATIGLMLLGKADILVVERARVAVTDAVVPILDALSKPAATTARAIEEAQELIELRRANEELREANVRLQQWEHVARRLESENQRLTELLNYVPEPAARFVTGRVIGDSGGAFVRSRLVAAGTRDGVRKGQAAMTGTGVIGRVVEAGERHARVLLITDLNSRIPVMVERTREHAVMAGDNSQRPRLLYLPVNARLNVGDRIVTSGQGGIFPPGLPVGEVVQVSALDARLQPLADLGRLEVVRLVEYQVEGPAFEAEPPAQRRFVRPAPRPGGTAAVPQAADP